MPMHIDTMSAANMLNILRQYADETNDKQLLNQCLEAGADPNFNFSSLSTWDQRTCEIVLNFLRQNGLSALAATYPLSQNQQSNA